MLHEGRADESLWPYANLAARWRRPVLIGSVITGVVVGVVVHLLPRQYVARASFIRSDPPQSASGAGGAGMGMLAQQMMGAAGGLPNLGAFGLDAGSSMGVTSPQFYATLIESRGILHSVVTATYTFGRDGHTGDLVSYFKIQRPTREEAEIRAIKLLKKQVKVSSDRLAGIVTIDVTTTDHALSAEIAERFLDLVSDFNMRRLQSQAGAEAAFAERQAGVAMLNLRSAEDALADFKERNRATTQAPTLETEENRLQRRVLIAQQIYLSLAQRLESSKGEAVRNTPVITVIDPPDGLIEALPRYAALLALGSALAAAILILCYGAVVERLPAIRAGPGYAEFRRLMGRPARRN
jgi:uncharacterized protein involved in exopolysaccharide biosynthesis